MSDDLVSLIRVLETFVVIVLALITIYKFLKGRNGSK